jgi:hypothetical protein
MARRMPTTTLLGACALGAVVSLVFAGAGRTGKGPAGATWVDAAGEDPGLGQRQERLAQLAATTRDPRVYALAFRECRKGAEDDTAPACRLLTALQWARLDRGNALPWVYVLGDASVNGDVAERDEALFQIASSEQVSERPFAAARVIIEHAPPDGVGLVAANELVTRALALSDGQILPLYALLSACHNGADDDSNVAQLCAETSDLLVRRSDTLTMRRMGGAMDYAITGDASRRDRVRDAGARLGAAPRLHAAGGCASLRDVQDFERRAGEIGEVDALRERAGTRTSTVAVAVKDPP